MKESPQYRPLGPNGSGASANHPGSVPHGGSRGHGPAPSAQTSAKIIALKHTAPRTPLAPRAKRLLARSPRGRLPRMAWCKQPQTLIHWNGRDVPSELRALPAGTYVIERTLTADEARDVRTRGSGGARMYVAFPSHGSLGSARRRCTARLSCPRERSRARAMRTPPLESEACNQPSPSYSGAASRLAVEPPSRDVFRPSQSHFDRRLAPKLVQAFAT